MENKVLIDLSVKYGLDDDRLSKLSDMMYQLGFDDSKDPEYMKAAGYICDAELIDLPAEEVVEEMKRKGYFRG